jgi:putative thioredoxin
LAGAVDLSALKAKADAARSAPTQPASPAPAVPVGGQARPNFIIDVTEASFEADVVQLSMQVPVVVDLWAEWCQPCKQLSPVLEKLALEGNGSWVLAKVDVDANPRIAQMFQAQSIPMVIAVAGGQPIDAFSGAQPEPQLREWITALLDALREQLPGISAAERAAATLAPEPEADPRLVAAEVAFSAGEFAAAASEYEKILAVEPAHAEAKLGLTQATFAQRASSVDYALVMKADEDPADVAAVLAAADAQIASGQVEQAFARLTTLVRLTAGADRAAARDRLVSLFELFDADDPNVLTARRNLANAMF